MAMSRQPKIILTFAALGAVIALTICVVGQFLRFNPSWVTYVVLIACPSSLMLMATEGCNGIFSWCSIQVVLLVILFNAVLYATIAAIYISVVHLVSRLRRSAA